MNIDWILGPGLESLPRFATALAIGLLIGLERERHPESRAGLRTFAIIALTGASAAAIATETGTPSLIAVGLVMVALALIAAYHDGASREREPGTTTIAAAMLCYLLAVMSLYAWLHLAAILAITTTALLYFKSELGGFARAMERRDLISILQFALVAFIVLPLLPDTDFGPNGALNPRQVWWMVVLISGVSLAGYVALRLGGGARSSIVLGLLGGLVSSTATTLAYSRHGNANAAFAPLAARVILTANLVVLARLTVLCAVVAPAMLSRIATLLGLGFTAGIVAYVLSPQQRLAPDGLEPPRLENPAEMRAALAFAALYALVLLIAAWLSSALGSEGVYAIAALSGMLDVDAITLSSFRLAELRSVTEAQAATAIAIALFANVTFKLGVVRVAGGSVLFWRCLPSLVAVALAVTGAAAWMQ